MKYWGPVCVLAFFAWLVVHYWWRLTARDTPYTRRWLLEWIIKGLVLPIAFWVYLNCGTTPVVPPIVKIAVVKAGAVDQFKLLWAQTRPAIVIISSYWAALSMGWYAVGIFRGVEDDRKSVFISCLVIFVFLSPFAGLTFFCYGLKGIGFALLIWFWPVVHYGLSLKPKLHLPPTYTRAVAKMKFGKYGEAETVIIEELERCESDFAGWMMLADLYANHFDDVAEAERTICELCDEPTTTAPQISIALHRLADWQLKLRQDPTAARRVLEEICKRMPGTHMEKMARLRINQLPANKAEWIERQKVKTISLPVSSGNLHVTDGPEDKSEIKPEEALARANLCVEKLERDPNDVTIREELAAIFADQLGQVDLAIEQLELLVAMPEQTDERVAQCLTTLAGWQIKYRQDERAARTLLERIVHEYPRTPQAFPAQRRLSFMTMEERNRRRGLASPLAADKPA